MYNIVRYVLLLVCLLLASGCSRTLYRTRADRRTYDVLAWQSAAAPWMPHEKFTIQPDPRSRFFDPTPPDDPQLPIPAPRLYAYDLPAMPPRDPRRFRPSGDGGAPQEIGPLSQYIAVNGRAAPQPPVRLASFEEEIGPPAFAEPIEESQAAGEEYPVGGELRVAPIPEDVWESIPPSCLRRMFEFPSMRAEYKLTFGREPTSSQRDPSPRLALEDIVELGLINSREYQTRKEALYSVALRLTLARFDYQLSFSPLGNGTDVDFAHQRAGGITQNTLGIPTTANVDQVLATGGNLVARFANDIVLTFNGANGFAADVGSELLLSFSQSVFQRDVVFEGLTQNEREVVYAARDYRRFRKGFFRDLAEDYYTLIRTYRQIEIDAQDYFSNLRGFNQGQAEFRVGRRSRIQVDQVEQDALNSRSRLIGTCNSLENAIDNLKLVVGLPTEQPINIDLTELNELTLRDEVTVAAELVRRAHRSLDDERTSSQPDRYTMQNRAIRLCNSLLDWRQLLRKLGQDNANSDELRVLLARLEVETAEQETRFIRVELDEARRAVPVNQPLVYGRSVALIDAVLALIERQLQLAGALPGEYRLGEVRGQLATLRGRLDTLRDALQLYSTQRRESEEVVQDRWPELVATADELAADVDQLSASLFELLKRPPLTADQELEQAIRQVELLLQRSEGALAEQELGLTPVELDMDEAMLTALVKRFDLMNQRGVLADFWRQVKLAADDLKSILNLNAAQTVRTREGVNRVLDLTWDESTTDLELSFDTPLNRFSQGNAFRQSLINYNAALRGLMQLEDTIKLQVRDDLRDLQLDREQYSIAIASAALASERVRSTRLQWQRGFGNVNARDLLEAQRAYTASVSAIANQHIGYIVDRIDLFFDLELLEVDTYGFWPELYDEEHQPTPHFAMPHAPPYGVLPAKVLYSRKIQRMLGVPPGTPMVFETAESDEAEPENAEANGLELLTPAEIE